MRLVALLALLTLVACSRAPDPAPQPPSPVAKAHKAPEVAAPSAASLPIEITAGAIGGCGMSCSTPEVATVYFFDSLKSENIAAALRSRIDPSRFAVNDHRIGPNRAEFEDWLATWPSWTRRSADPSGLVRARASGIALRRDPENAPEFIVLYRHPQFPGDLSVPRWRFRFALRGKEWLLIALDDREPAPVPAGAAVTPTAAATPTIPQ